MEKTDEKYYAERATALEKIVLSSAHRRVVVAGPGCGKTYTFGEVLKRSVGPNLVLTFINNLAADLDKVLAQYADVSTFHKFSRILLHTLPVAGLTHGVDYYPPLRHLFVADIALTDGAKVTPQDVDNGFHNLDGHTGIIGLALRSGTYYDAVSHADAVYRVFRHLDTHPESVPGYDQVVVDEYQDFSFLEVSFINLLAARNRMLAAGDDDQALYAFKGASPGFLREIAEADEWESFALPYCSRCPPALVEATHRIVAAAQDVGALAGRLPKPFECFLPAKRNEAEKYPRIVHAQCTVQRNNAPYMSRYVADEIGKIPTADIEASKSEDIPTVLVIGPNPFVGQVGAYLEERYPSVQLRQPVRDEIHPLHGYMRLVVDDASRLGWRILTLTHPPVDDIQEVVARCILDGRELREELPAEYVAWHLDIVAMIRVLKETGALSDSERADVEAATGVPYDELLVELGLAEAQEEDSADEDRDGPTIICTTLVGAKGLQAEHVFVVGVSNGHLPRVAATPTDGEVCQFLVSLTRARKSCTIVTCNRLGHAQLRPSLFIGWLGDLVQTTTINREYFGD